MYMHVYVHLLIYVLVSVCKMYMCVCGFTYMCM